MTVSDVDLFTFTVPLTAPLQLGDNSVKTRRGLLIRLRSEDGATGWGEASPLPGFSRETLTDVVNYARSVRSDWTGRAIPVSQRDVVFLLETFPFRSDCPPALQFGFECAVVDLIASARDENLSNVLGESRDTVLLNGLVSNVVDGRSEAVEQLRETGYRAVKVKVGRAPLFEEAEGVRALSEKLGEGVALRLDANRAWALESALRFAEAIRSVEIDYLEEPVSDPTDLAEFVTQTGLSIALDETTRETNPDVLTTAPWVSAVILKPTLLGSIQDTWTWIQIAKNHDVTPVISASYETGIGLRMLTALAAVGPDTPVGLSTYDRLRNDVVRPRLPITGPSVDVETVCAPVADVDWSRLDPVTESPE